MFNNKIIKLAYLQEHHGHLWVSGGEAHWGDAALRSQHMAHLRME